MGSIINLLYYLYTNYIQKNLFKSIEQIVLENSIGLFINGDISIIKHYNDLIFYNELKPSLINNKENFLLACKNGHLELCQWLYHNKKRLNININHNEILYVAIKNGHLSICEWILETNKKKYKNICHIFWIFYLACLNGALNIAKYLFYNYPDIEITYKNNLIFIKFIYIYTNFENYEINDRYREITEWFVKLKPDLYFIEMDNDVITKIGILKQIDIIYNNTNNLNIHLNNTELCSICYEKTECVTPCHHFFCIKCIQEWYRKNDTCPYCRNKIYVINKLK